MAYVKIGNITVDAALSEGYALESEVTSYPRESGPNVTDHVRGMPRTIALEGFISDAPLGADLVALRDRETAGIRAPSDFAYSQLLAVYNAREPITITTSLGVYENMVMTACNITRDKDTSKALAFSCTFQEIVIVTNERVTIRSVSKLGFKSAKVYKTQVIKLANGNTESRVIYDNGPRATPRYTYGDGSTFVPKTGNVYETPTAEQVRLDKNSAGATRAGQTRIPNTPVKPYYQP